MDDGGVPLTAQHQNTPHRRPASGTDACHPPTPMSLAPMPRPEAEERARTFKAVSDPTRVQLLGMIEASPGGEACVCDLTTPLGLRQPTVSHHLKILADAGLVTREKRGTWVWYAIAPERLDALRALLR